MRKQAFATAMLLMLVSSEVDARSPGANAEPTKRQGQEMRPPTLEELHDALRTTANLHDQYLYLQGMGNEKTVPLLLERLRLDYGVGQPGDPSETLMAFDCAQLHLVDALRGITNTDQGMYYPKWKAWWEAHGNSTRSVWVQEGFRQAGFHPREPIDDRFGLELIRAIAVNKGFLAFNASRLLDGVAMERKGPWVAQASDSQDRLERLGAIRALSGMGKTGHEGMLRKLTRDADEEVRHDALAALNECLRVSHQGRARALSQITEDNWMRAIVFSGDLIVSVLREGQAEARNVETGEVEWKKELTPGVGDSVLVNGEKIILASQEGDIDCIDGRGSLLWHRSAQEGGPEIRRLVKAGEDTVAMRPDFVERLDTATGALKSAIRGKGLIVDGDAWGDQGWFADDGGLRWFGNGSVPDQQIPRALGVSVSEEMICVTTNAGENRIVCLDGKTRQMRWAQKVRGENGTWGHSVAPVLDGLRVYVLTDQCMSALGAKDGSVLWSIYAGQEAQGRTAATADGILTVNQQYQIELRDATTGEVKCEWGETHGVSTFAVSGHIAAMAGRDRLWLLDLTQCSQASGSENKN